MAEIKANTLDVYLIVISTCLYFWYNSFIIRSQFSSCDICGTCPIDSAMPRYQSPPPPPAPCPFKNPGWILLLSLLGNLSFDHAYPNFQPFFFYYLRKCLRFPTIAGSCLCCTVVDWHVLTTGKAYVTVTNKTLMSTWHTFVGSFSSFCRYGQLVACMLSPGRPFLHSIGKFWAISLVLFPRENVGKGTLKSGKLRDTSQDY